MSKKTKAQELQEQLTWSAPHIGKDAPDHKEKAFKYCEGYKQFLNAGKTERECVKEAVHMLKKAGYKPFDRTASYEPGDKVYYVNRRKAIIATTFGKKPLSEGLHINGAHIDSPRLDLKPNPLYEKEDIAYFKTHYYGGIRKYQWGTIPLAIHGVVAKKNGELTEICIGEKEDDPVFCITDLLPHLAAKQNERPLREGLKGEELNVVLGSLPYEGEDIKDAVKLSILALLHEQYGMKEKDFFRAEFELVPAVKARDIGLDRSLVGAYGQDDRVCAYTALTAEIDTKKPEHTTVTILTDKEETYKAWDFSFSLRASLNNYVYYNFLVGKANSSSSGLFSNTAFSNITPESIELGFAGQGEYYMSDYFVRNASFLRCDNITLGYSFKDLLKSSSYKGIGGRIYATCQNPFIITKYPGLDPEVQSGIDSNPYPRALTFLLGVSLQF